MRFSMSDRQVLCIDWDERSLQVVDAHCSRAGVRVLRAVHQPLPAGMNTRDADQLGAFIRRTLSEHRIRTRRVIVDVPRQDVVLNAMSLPGGTTDELTAMVHVQIAKELPFTRDRAVIDFAAAPEADGGKCAVWVSAARDHVIDHYREVMTAAGLKLERLGLRSYANVAAVTAGGKTDGHIVTVDVGPAMTEITVLRDGRLAFSRVAQVAVPAAGLMTSPRKPEPEDEAGSSETIPLMGDGVPGPRPIEVLLIDVSRTIEAYRATAPGSTVNRIVLSGSIELDERIREAFERRFGASTELYHPSGRVAWRLKAGEAATPFAATIGLALSHMADRLERFDFLHPKEPEEQRRERARRRPLMIAAASVVVFMLIWLGYRPIRDLQHTRNLEAAILHQAQGGENSKEEQKIRKDVLDKRADLDGWLDQGVVWLDALNELFKVFPGSDQAFITKLDADERNQRIEINLAVKDLQVASDLIRAINGIEVARIKDGQEKKVKLFKAVTSDPKDMANDPTYRYTETVIINLQG